MIEYQNGKIYKLTSDENDILYIGSTVQKLNLRLQNHLSRMKRGASKTYIQMRSYSNIKIELLENYPCEDRAQLSAREGDFIRKHLGVALNKRIAGRTIRTYYLDNREKICLANRIYYHKNRVYILGKLHAKRETTQGR